MPNISSSGCHRNLRMSQLVWGRSSSFQRLPDSITPTRKPFPVARSAATLPPNPEPITITSKSKPLVVICLSPVFDTDLSEPGRGAEPPRPYDGFAVCDESGLCHPLNRNRLLGAYF